MDHAAHRALLAKCDSLRAASTRAAAPSLPGNDAFGAIAEVIRILDADPATDWATVNIEALRQHLMDMHEVTLHATVRQASIPGGMQAVVTGSRRTRDAIRSMLVAHSATMNGASAEYQFAAVQAPHGARLTVTAKDPSNAALVSRIRALGVVGLLTEGNHHAPHHLMIARGASPHER